MKVEVMNIEVTKKPEPWLWAVGSLALLARFFAPGLVPFILDEPILQLRLDAAMAGNLTFAHGLMGSVGLEYGPTPLWFYALGRILFGDSVRTPFLVMTLVFSAGIIALATAITSARGKKAGAWAFALLSTSPFLFHYSRTAWDNPFQFPLIAFAVCALTRGKGKPSFWFFAVASLALACGTHLMALFPAAALLVIGWRALPPENKWRDLAVGALIFIAVCFPYWIHLGKQLWSLHLITKSEAPRHAKGFFLPLLHWVSALSFWWTDYFFNSRATILREFWGPLPILILFSMPFGWILRVVSLFSSLRAMWSAAPLLRAGAWGAIMLFLALWWKRLELHPHYLLGVIWVPFWVAASWLSEKSWSRLRTFIGAGVLITNLVFVGLSYGFLREYSGTRADHFSTTLAELQSTSRSLCDLVRSKGDGKFGAVYLDHVYVFPPALEWVSRREEACQGIFLVFAERPENLNRPPNEIYRVTYREPTGLNARLEVHTPSHF